MRAARRGRGAYWESHEILRKYLKEGRVCLFSLRKYLIPEGIGKYFDENGRLPERIFLFRDGCGDGQIPVVYNQELPEVLCHTCHIEGAIRAQVHVPVKFTL